MGMGTCATRCARTWGRARWICVPACVRGERGHALRGHLRPSHSRAPARTVDAAGTTQADVARFGFYTFNLDVYVDHGRRGGLGPHGHAARPAVDARAGQRLGEGARAHPAALRGARGAAQAVAGGGARGGPAQQGALSESAVRALEAQVVRQLEERVFFATRIRVSGATVSFFVPEGFLGGQAQPTWGYAVAVTGGTLDSRVELPALLGGVTAPASQGLMVLGIGPGVSPERFGGGRLGDPAQSPVVDLMVPEGVRQEEVLGPQAPGWPAVVPASPALPQAPDAGGVPGQGDAPGARHSSRVSPRTGRRRAPRPIRPPARRGPRSPRAPRGCAPRGPAPLPSVRRKASEGRAALGGGEQLEAAAPQRLRGMAGPDEVAVAREQRAGGLRSARPRWRSRGPGRRRTRACRW